MDFTQNLGLTQRASFLRFMAENLSLTQEVTRATDLL